MTCGSFSRILSNNAPVKLRYVCLEIRGAHASARPPHPSSVLLVAQSTAPPEARARLRSQLPLPAGSPRALGFARGVAVTPEWAAAGQATETAGGARPLPAGEESCEIHVLCLPPIRTATDPGTPGESPRLAVRCLRVWVAVLSQPRAPGCPRHPRMAQLSPPIGSGASPVCM